MVSKRLPLFLAALGLGCGPGVSSPASLGTSPPPVQPRPSSVEPAVFKTSLESVGLDGASLDRTANPCGDFYQFACGGWLAANEIPGDEASWMRSFSEIAKRNEQELHRILEEASKQASADELNRKVGDFYGSCMDESVREAGGSRPIAALLARAGRVQSPATIGAFIGELHSQRIWALFDIASAQDFKDATKVIAQLDQNGLGLPDRDYYLKDDERSIELRRSYTTHVEKMMQLIGLSERGAKAAAVDVIAVETALARVSKTRVERRDPKGLYNPVDRAQLSKLAPEFPWAAYFKSLGVATTPQVNLTSIPFFEGMSPLLRTVKPVAWQSYLKWQIARSLAPALSKSFADESFRLTSTLTGQKEDLPRWRKCVRSTDAALGELLAQPFIRSNFAGESKQAAERMVHEISRAFATELGRLDWMDDATKQRAREKLDAMAYLIGYPDRWRTYDFTVNRKEYGANVLAARAFETQRDLAKVGKPLDRDEWQMSPPTVNAYYDPQRNHMVFPAGILQPPFYSVKSSIPVNLGGVGMVVGHELTHGFDDEGSQFDGKGNLADWWSPTVGEAFKKRTGCVASQFAEFEALPGLKLNGKLTLGENIADLGGLKLAFQAYRAMRFGAAEVTEASGFSEDQQFFLAHAQAWCGQMRDEALRVMVATNPHSPPRFRVNGPLMNMPEFTEAFQCTAGTPMRPANTCSVW
ncbi:M13 family metallopeptidase [Chondromyces crocatus]|nr:M13 family metallopeptidase [Chondromyces crocatus]